jgi:signal transduction histidine kinase
MEKGIGELLNLIQKVKEDQALTEETLIARLRSYTILHAELFGAIHRLLLLRNPSTAGVLLENLAESRSEVPLRGSTHLRRYLDDLFGPESQLELLEQEARQLFGGPAIEESGTVRNPSLELIPLTKELLAEVIPIRREGQILALLVFTYEVEVAPDSSKRVLARMFPEFLVGEFVRSVQTERLLSLTFHHISAPISAMRVMLRSLISGYIEPAEQQFYLEELLYVAEDCRMMIENQQNYTRMVRGISAPVNLEHFDITEEAEFRRRIIAHKYKGSKQMLLKSYSPGSIKVYLDRMMVGDIIQNLLDNACKYSPAKSEIRLKLRGAKRDVFVEVSDDGPGLPEHVSTIFLFNEGARGEIAAKSQRPGLGLGLYMVYRYATWLDGNIWWESSAKHGTTFTVQLPREAKG